MPRRGQYSVIGTETYNPREGEPCNLCNLEPARFAWQKSAHGRYRWMKQPCKTCKQKYNRHKKYKLSAEEHQALVEKQQGRCAICNRPVKLMVDHDHLTGLVRGLLCTHCNRGLGSFYDNPNLLSKAINYLRRNT